MRLIFPTLLLLLCFVTGWGIGAQYPLRTHTLVRRPGNFANDDAAAGQGIAVLLHDAGRMEIETKIDELIANRDYASAIATLISIETELFVASDQARFCAVQDGSAIGGGFKISGVSQPVNSEEVWVIPCSSSKSKSRLWSDAARVFALKCNRAILRREKITEASQ